CTRGASWSADRPTTSSAPRTMSTPRRWWPRRPTPSGGSVNCALDQGLERELTAQAGLQDQSGGPGGRGGGGGERDGDGHRAVPRPRVGRRDLRGDRRAVDERRRRETRPGEHEQVDVEQVDHRLGGRGDIAGRLVEQ